MSIKRKYISIDAQSKESLQEVRLINQNNVLHAQEVRLLNPETQQMDDIRDIFFNKEDGQQIAETIKESVKEELQGEYITSQDADSRFVSKEDAEDFALRSELEGLASEDQIQATVQAAMGEVENTYLKKEDAETTYAKKEDVQEAIDDVKSLDEQTYLKKEDAGQLATKEELQSAEQSIESSVQQTYLSIEDASRTYLSQTDAASLASKSEVASAKQEVLGQVDGTYAKKGEVEAAKSEVLEYVESIYARKEEVQKVVLSGIEKIDLDSEYTLTDVAAKVNEILGALKGSDGGDDEGGEGDDEPEPDVDPEITRVVYTEESGLPACDVNIVGILEDVLIPNRESIKEIYIGNAVEEIYNDAFSGCSELAIVSMPDSITNISGYAFSNCNSLTTITIPSSVVQFSPAAFEGSRFTSMTFEGKTMAQVKEIQMSLQPGTNIICSDGSFVVE